MNNDVLVFVQAIIVGLAAFLVIAALLYALRWILGIVRLRFRKPGALPGQGFIRTHPWWTIGLLVLLWIALTNFAFTKALLIGFFAKPINGVIHSLRDAPTLVNTLPQGKSVGGPLLWNEGAKVNLRPRVTKERRDKNGNYFAGIIPPRSSIYATYVAYEIAGWLGAYLIDYTSIGKFLPGSDLNDRGTTKDGEPVAIFSMPALSEKGRYEHPFENESEQIVEAYIQTRGTGPEIINVTHSPGTENVIQYEVKVGLNETWFTIPDGNWRWAWVAAVHTKAYQASMDEISVPAEGVKGGDYRNHLAVMATIDGKKSMLEKAVLIRPEGRSISISLLLNNTEENTPEGSVEPAIIIVGIQI